jgi:TP53 regulating kinase-like protein
MAENIIAQAAEAIIIKEEDKVTKRRIKKSYRIEVLDEKLRKQRTRSEAKILVKASSLINVPQVLDINEKSKEIKMKFIEGKKLSEHLDGLKNQLEIAEQIGKDIAKLHDADIIHGDLTTSNMIYKENENKVYFIDFGLGFISKRAEDKAVDLHLLRQALEAKHFSCYKELFDSMIKSYNSKDKDKILKQLEKVEARGRYKKGF